MNASVNKIWLTICGKSIIEHTLETLEVSGFFDLIVLVINEMERDEFESFLKDRPAKSQTPVYLTDGGRERQDSVERGLQFLHDHFEWSGSRRLVVIHDAARALITPEILRLSIDAGLKYRAVGVGVPVKDTIKQVNADGLVVSTPDRSGLWIVQTPQIFDYNLIFECYQKVFGLGRIFSDDCAVVEYCGYPVKLVMGSYENLKITTAEDIVVAEGIIRRRADAGRSGI